MARLLGEIQKYHDQYVTSIINIDDAFRNANNKKMETIQKTFDAEVNPREILNWVNEIVWAYTKTIEHPDPAEWEYMTYDKIKIKIEVHVRKQELL